MCMLEESKKNLELEEAMAAFIAEVVREGGYQLIRLVQDYVSLRDLERILRESVPRDVLLNATQERGYMNGL